MVQCQIVNRQVSRYGFSTNEIACKAIITFKTFLGLGKGMEFDYLAEFYKQRHDEKSLIKGIDSLLSTYHHENLRVKTFPCFIDEIFLNKILNNKSKLQIIYQNTGVYLIKYSHKIKRDQILKTINGQFFILKNESYENVYSIITLDGSEFFKYLLNFFHQSYPHVSLTFITHHHLQKLLAEFREKNFFTEFKIVKASVKYRVGKAVFSSVHWQDFLLEKAFEWVKEENGWFENITANVGKKMSLPHKVFISREGVVKTNGFFSAVFSGFIAPISKIVHENVKFFGRRARLENNGEVKPLCIDFEYEHFTSLDENKKFIEAMRKMKTASVSVIHGNPYVQISIIDYFDGSSYDIWVLSKNKIIIVPQLRSSFQAVKRLINHIFDNYYEGKIKEYGVNNAENV